MSHGSTETANATLDWPSVTTFPSRPFSVSAA